MKLFRIALASCLLPLVLHAQSLVSDLNVQRTAKFGSHSTGTITPAQITADQNNYAPTGYAAAFRMRLSSDAARNLTGLAAGAGGGGTIVLVNVGSFAITLKDESASSTAANRFALSGDYILAADTAVFLEYDATSTRWRLLGATTATVVGSLVDDTAYDATSWNGVTTIAPSKNSVRDVVETLAPKASPTFTGTPAAPTAADGTNTTQIATTAFVRSAVDAATQALDLKASVRVISTSNLTLSGTQTVDGVALVAGDRILVAGQSTGAQNGIYVVAAGAWSRATDADTSADVTSGMYAYVSEGTANGSNGYVLTTPEPIVLGTTALTYTQFSGAGQIIAGTGLAKSGNTLSTSNIPNASLANSAITIAGTSVSLGGSITLDTITGLGTAGLVKRTGSNAYAIATAATDYVAPSAYASANGLTMATARLLGRTTASTGAAEEISVGASLSLASGTLQLPDTITASSVGSSTAIPVLTFDAKGRLTAASTAAVVAPAGTLSGTTLNSTVVTSSLTTVGALNAGSITSGFGAIDIGSDSLTAGATTVTTLVATGGLTSRVNATIGTGGALSVSDGLLIDSSSAASYGAFVSLRAAGAEKGVVALKKVLVGGTSNDLTLYSNSDNVVVYAAGTLSSTFLSTGMETKHLAISGTSGQISTVNSTHANGLYVTYLSSGSPVGDVGSATQVFGAGTALDFGVTSRSATLYLGSGSSVRATLSSSALTAVIPDIVIDSSSSAYLKLDRASTSDYSGIQWKTAGSTTGGWEFYGSNATNQTINLYSYQASAAIQSWNATGSTITGALAISSTLSTAAGVAYNFGGYTAGAPTADGYLTFVANGTTYRVAVDQQ